MSIGVDINLSTGIVFRAQTADKPKLKVVKTAERQFLSDRESFHSPYAHLDGIRILL
jgi:hypothetical protein